VCNTELIVVFSASVSAPKRAYSDFIDMDDGENRKQQKKVSK